MNHVDYLNQYRGLELELATLREETDNPLRKAEINNILTPVIQITQALLEDEEITLKTLAETASEVRNRIMELKKNPDSAGQHDRVKNPNEPHEDNGFGD